VAPLRRPVVTALAPPPRGRARLFASRLAAGLCAAVLTTVPPTASAHDGTLEVRSTGDGFGRLTVTGLPTGKLLLVQGSCAGGSCLFTNDDITFAAPYEDLVEPASFALQSSTAIRLEFVSADPGASVKFGSNVLDAPGESVQIGSAWSMHSHVKLQVSAAQAQLADWTIVVRLTTKSSNYESSASIPFVVTTASTTSTTASTSTTVETSSTTLSASQCGDGFVETPEECDAGPAAWSPGMACRNDCTLLACGDPDGDGKLTATDALFVLRGATGTQACDACVCDVDASAGAAPVSVSDALRVLRIAIGLTSFEPNCTACA